MPPSAEEKSLFTGINPTTTIATYAAIKIRNMKTKRRNPRQAERATRFSPAAEYLGETTLLQSVWRIACAEGLQVHVQLLDSQATAHADRRALAGHLRERIATALRDGDQG